MQTHFSGSAHQAKAILGAWHSGDTERLRKELDRVSAIRPADSAEEERLELLSEIARELRQAAQPSGVAVCGSLLKHLASSGQPALQRRATRALEYGRAAAATALQ
jgi:hypothetical protein